MAAGTVKRKFRNVDRPLLALSFRGKSRPKRLNWARKRTYCEGARQCGHSVDQESKSATFSIADSPSFAGALALTT